MKRNLLLFTLLAILSFASGLAQQRNTHLTIKVNTVEGDILTGQPVSLTQTDYSVGYGSLTLNAQGECSLNVFAGNHMLQIDRNGFNAIEHTFAIADGETEKTVTIDLTEKTRDPFAINAEVSRDPFTGRRDIALSWNREKPAFFDDFESYDPFAITFGDWTGIDADGEATAALSGIYPNRGVMQYAQIINPLTVTPTWWYDYPILRPYSGQQYVGFIRTNSGNANDDWLITPAITVGTENILSFKAKAADRYDERFMVYVTTKLDNPEASDFTRIDTGNYESVDYRGWHTLTYDLARYAGQTVKFAIRYISHTNIYGAFM
ncbi:MAG: choice-of-anchor J domain-containing protein, partial [Muribaculaceae bacterium]|nr:choice-of-anchor J domain-containing protein [Muribaculaceae bacterium]